MLSEQQIKDSVSIVAKEYPIKRVDLFGSYASGNNHQNSDVDLLVEFHTDRVSLLTLNSVKYLLEELLVTDVDLIHGPLPKDSMIKADRRIPLYGT